MIHNQTINSCDYKFRSKTIKFIPEVGYDAIVISPSEETTVGGGKKKLKESLNKKNVKEKDDIIGDIIIEIER